MRHWSQLSLALLAVAGVSAAGAWSMPETRTAVEVGAAPKVPQLAPMRVVRVKSDQPGCEPDCPEWISAEGMIDENTLPQFRKILKELGTKKLPVLIDSGGGLVDDSLAIARLIRARGLDIAVAKTVPSACAAALPENDACRQAKLRGAPTGHPRSYLARCASSCAFILAGGVRRFVGPAAFVGVHQLKTLQTSAQLLRKYRIETKTEWGVPVEVRRVLISEKRINEKTTIAHTPDSAYAKVTRFFAEMGVSETVMPLLRSTPNSAIHWRTRAELKSTAMATDMADGEALVAANARKSPTLSRIDASKIDASREVGSSPLPPPGALPSR